MAIWNLRDDDAHRRLTGNRLGIILGKPFRSVMEVGRTLWHGMGSDDR